MWYIYIENMKYENKIIKNKKKRTTQIQII